ncbi:MAG: DUF4956 domain-containing protein [Paludibacter sp.]|jgi:hypothetical protein|nr:DUF4956 domain-containing protein [Paludibacter sp.]
MLNKLFPICLKAAVLVLLLCFSGNSYSQQQDKISAAQLTEKIDSAIFAAANIINNTYSIDEFDVKLGKQKDKIALNQYFFVGLGIDIAAVLLILFFVYFPNYRKLDTIFTFIMFNIVIFLLTFVLNKVKISMGAAFGLFAVFAMLRYRTTGIGIKDMTYLFIFIALGLVCGIQLEWYVLAVIVAVIFVFILIFDTKLLFKKEFSNTLRYEKIELIKPDKKQELIDDLCLRTGYKIHNVSIIEIDFLRDTAMVTYYYYE